MLYLRALIRNKVSQAAGKCDSRRYFVPYWILCHFGNIERLNMMHRTDIKAVAIRNDHIGRTEWAMRALISLLSVVIILGTPLTEGTAIG